jgi:protein required for attachment to host cells
MADVKIGENGWVVVCDGRKAIVLENVGDAAYPDLRVKDTEVHEAPRTSDLGTDKPGTVHQSHEAMRSSVGQTDWHDREEEAFLRSLADRLDKAVVGKETTGVVIVAPPRALGMIRKAYSHALRQAIVAEIDKDLTGVPADELEERILGGRR